MARGWRWGTGNENRNLRFRGLVVGLAGRTWYDVIAGSGTVLLGFLFCMAACRWKRKNGQHPAVCSEMPGLPGVTVAWTLGRRRSAALQPYSVASSAQHSTAECQWVSCCSDPAHPSLPSFHPNSAPAWAGVPAGAKLLLELPHVIHPSLQPSLHLHHIPLVQTDESVLHGRQEHHAVSLVASAAA